MWCAMKGGMNEADSRSQPAQLVLLWGVLGFCALLFNALLRLTPIALEPLGDGMAPWQWAVLVVWVAFNGYTEGYKAFQKQVSPRVVARAQWLAHNPKPALVVFAPLFCMGFFYATRKRMIVSWTITVMIVVLVVSIRHVDQPWRGIVDCGVVVGLGWGLAAQLWYLGRGLLGHEMVVDPDLPASASRG